MDYNTKIIYYIDIMTLTEAAHWTKKLIWFVLIGFFLLFTITSLILRIDRTHDPLYGEANYSCTDYASDFTQHRLDIPSLSYTPEPGEFRIETDTGRFEQFPEIINVYRYANPGQTLTSQRDAKLIAESLGFDSDGMERVGTTIYRWRDNNHRELNVEARNLPFIFQTNLTRSSARPPTDDTVPPANEAINTARAFLRSANLLDEDYANEPPTTIDIAIQSGGDFREAEARIEADLVRVDFQRMKPMITIPENMEGAEALRENLERKIADSTRYRSSTETVQTPDGPVNNFTFDIELVTQDPNRSNISVYVGAKNPNWERGIQPNIYYIEYKNWIIEPEHCGRYELISPDMAIRQIQSGYGSLVYLRENNADRVIPHQPNSVERFEIKNISLRYYDAPYEQEFLQPIYVVYGDAIFTTGTLGEFIFYYPAIDYDLVQDSREE